MIMDEKTKITEKVFWKNKFIEILFSSGKSLIVPKKKLYAGQTFFQAENIDQNEVDTL